MLSFSDYQILAQLYESPNSLVYRAVRNDDQQPVILKQLQADYPTPAELTRYRHEFEILSQLTLPGVIQAYELKPYQNSLLLVLEDFGGDSFKVLTQQRRLTLAELLPLFIQAADSLGQVHAADLIHKDINSNNVVCNLTTGQVKLIDFGLASRLPRENPTLQSPNQLEGTLAYLSPEQTGRMNRALDYRTDLYSLGVTFYELLTGQLPFVSTDPLEMVHGHLAKRPVPVAEVNPQIPPILSDVVMKLMAKNAEDRYQSAFGLKYDLEQILARQNSTPNLTVLSDLSGFDQNSNLLGLTDLAGFKLAQQDISGRFHLPQKLYGRETEIQTLWQAVDRISQGTAELLLIAGYSGIGKTALVQELYQPLTAKRGYFMAGKFDQFQRNVPYSAVVQAFRDLVRQLLTETSSQLEVWKTQLLTAVGNNGSVITAVIPEVELILGPQPAVPTLPPTESQNRFNLVFQNFIKVFCQSDHPLVIFLDDLQWIDSASLKLMTLMMNEIPYLLLLGAYRDNEVSPVHPLMTTLEEIQKEGSLVQTLTLTPLTLSQLNQLVSDTLQLPLDQTLPLAELVLEKTGGNPFFMGEFLKTLYVEHWLEFNPAHREWQWDLAPIRVRNITDNVVELMTAKIQRLALPTQVILKLAASVGNQFDLATLAVISQTSPEQVKTDLWEALKEGLVMPLGENYKLVHDRIQQAAYSLIPEADRPALHWQIGQLLKTHLGETLGERLFEVVDHLNQGSSLTTTTATEEKIQLIRLNLQAGQKAKASSAHGAAQRYLTMGMSLLAPDSWQTDYAITFLLYQERAEVEYLNANLELSAQLIQQALGQTQSATEKGELYNLLLIQHTLHSHHAQAIEVGRTALELLGVVLPSGDFQVALEAEFADIKQRIGQRPIASLIDAPEMTLADKQVAMKILNYLVPPTFMSCQPLFFIVDSKAVNLSLQHGHVPTSAYMYACYGILQCALLEDYATAYEFGSLALKLSEKFNNLVQKTLVLEVLVGHLSHWRKPLSLSHPLTQEAYQAGLQSGEIQFATYTFLYHAYNRFYEGCPLPQYVKEMEQYLLFARKTKNQIAIDVLRGCQLTVARLMDDPTVGTEVEELQHFEECQARNSTLFIAPYLILRAQIDYLLGQPQPALESAKAAEKRLGDIPGVISIAEDNFYYSLSLIALYPTLSPEQQVQALCQLETNQQRLQKWADNCPANFHHKYLLVAAEMARITHQDWPAVKLYNQAIQEAKTHHFIQQEALANERLAEFWLAHQQEEIASIYLSKAHSAYQRWGALAKVQHLQTQYPQFFTPKPSTMSPSFSYTRLATTSTSSVLSPSTGTQELDIDSIIKASQTLSEEIVLPRLLEKMMHIVIENAGAELGFLLLPKSTQWVIEAEGRVGQTQVTVLHSLAIEDNRWVSAAMIAYVSRTQQPLMLEAASHRGLFTRDPHVIQSQVHSVLVLPLKHQGVLTGILYLENNLTTGAFTADRLEVLNLISSQLAISIENALLYANLEQKVVERTQALSEALAHLKATQTHLIEVEKMAALGNLVAGVAHEINTPVGIGVTAATQLDKITVDFANLYKSGKMSRPDLEQYLNATYQTSSLILKNLTRAAELTQSFKQVAVDQTSEQRRTIVLQQYINEVLVSLKPKLKNTGYQVSVHCEETIKCTTYPGAFAQILTNLIMNSLQHGFQGRATGQITITAIPQERQVTLHYRDDGNGIAPDVISKIFEPFFTTNRQGGGTGLGLHIVYNLVTHKLNGTIRCHSELGEGVDFTLILPVD